MLLPHPRPRLLVAACAWLLTAVVAQAQGGQGSVDSALIERTIVEAKWKYVHTLHVGSSTIIHEAGDEYDFYLYFRYDYTAEEYLNGEYQRKAWALAGDQVFYPFRNVKLFRVRQASQEKLALEFTQPNSKGNYQYHFVRVSDDEAPFVKPVNQLPTALVEGYSKRRRKRGGLDRDDAVTGIKKDRRWWPFRRKQRADGEPTRREERLARREERLARRDERREDRQEEKATRKEARRYAKDGEAAVDMMIELTGGGFFGGIDPVMRDHTVIKPGGHMVKEFKTVNTDLRRNSVDIEVEEYNRLAKFIREQGFFELDRQYDCTTEMCQTRKRVRPTPVPLRIAIRIGNDKKVVNVAIWGQDRRGVNYVDIPKGLEEVIQAVLKVSNGATYTMAQG